MSLASYIGCNVEIPLTDPDSNDVIVFGPCFSDESMLEIVQEFQFKQVIHMKFQRVGALNLLSGKLKEKEKLKSY